jgi:hypothetical protein
MSLGSFVTPCRLPSSMLSCVSRLRPPFFHPIIGFTYPICFNPSLYPESALFMHPPPLLGLPLLLFLFGSMHPDLSFGFMHPVTYLGLRTLLFIWVYAPYILFGFTHPLFYSGLRARCFLGFTHPLFYLGLRTLHFIWVYAPVVFLGFMHPLPFFGFTRSWSMHQIIAIDPHVHAPITFHRGLLALNCCYVLIYCRIYTHRHFCI